MAVIGYWFLTFPAQTLLNDIEDILSVTILHYDNDY